ncbi:flavin reductase family protein [Kitasatospora brasiliensis]|uniref:flavin reductase family protein n=1 Tax=Kitasatospora brasiliensis TaxID=3058040 RepID=UPI002930976D|nr:flavin reductase family protein [Kitasatospora sp. K002]
MSRGSLLAASDELEPLFKDAMAALAGGVCVVTTTGPDGTPYGFAATSVTSVSLDPPMMLVCQAKSSRSYELFAGAGPVAINVLAAGQRSVAERFATPKIDKFAGTGFEYTDGLAPELPGALAAVQCRRARTIDAGDHSVLLLDVVAVRTAAGEPLVYHGRRYGRLELTTRG